MRVKGLNVPDQTFIKLRYSTFWSVSSSIVFPQIVVYRGNSIFDPEQTFTGNQPASADQWAAFYKTYQVHASKIKVRFFNLTSQGGENYPSWQCYVFPTLLTSAPSDLEPEDLPYSKVRYMTGPQSGRSMATITHFFSTRKIFQDYTPSNSDYEGLTGNSGTGSNPPKEWYWQTCISPVDLSSTPTGSMKVNVVLTYYTTLRNRKDLAPS